MKHLSLFFVVAGLFLCSCKKHSSPAPTYDTPQYTLFEGAVGVNALSAIVTSDNNVMILGSDKTGNAVLYKVSQTGAQLWTKTVATGDAELYSLAQSGDGGYLLCGTSYGHLGAPDIFVLKVNSEGVTQWWKSYGGSKEDYGGRIIRTSDGHYLVCGTSYSFTTEPYEDIYLLKINENGDTVWTHNYNLYDQQVPFHVMETQNGEYLVTGTNEPTNNERVIYLLKVSANGDKLWDKNIGSTTDPSHFYWWGYCTTEGANGELVVCGAYRNQLFAVKTDHVGNVLWQKQYHPDDSALQVFGSCIRKNGDNSFTTTANSYDYRDGSSKCVLLKFDNDGNSLYYKVLPGTNSYSGENLLKCGNDDNMIVGNNYLDTSVRSIFFTRMDGSGNYK
jgi:hypothetical protein